MTSARKVLLVGGLCLAALGMLYGLHYAVFVEHQTLDRMGASLAQAFASASQRDTVAANSAIDAYASTKYDYVRQVDVHSHWIGLGMVEIDRDTLIPRILDYVAVDDCGTVINPAIVEGQVYGATAHGIGAALLENCMYDAVGNMLTSTFSDYIPITAMNMPLVKYGHIQTPSPHSYSGAKGMGEGGAAPIHTISAALQDALFDKGVFIDDSFNNADTLFRALKGEIGRMADVVKVERRP